jgi:hypothetical protein
MEDLFCCEAQVDYECRAYADPVLLKDGRVLHNLLSSEERHVLSSSYFDCVQSELKPHMRKIVTEWMLEVDIANIYIHQCQSLVVVFFMGSFVQGSLRLMAP